MVSCNGIGWDIFRVNREAADHVYDGFLIDLDRKP